MENCTLHNIFKLPSTIVLSEADKSASISLQNWQLFCLFKILSAQVQNLYNIQVLLLFTWLKSLYAFLLSSAGLCILPNNKVTYVQVLGDEKNSVCI
jgi:hypothetical protein